MSYATMPYIAIPVPAPLFDARAARRAVRQGLDVGTFVLQSAGLAALLWLVLAGPSLV